MNPTDDFDDETCRREWELQERALREERNEISCADGATRLAQYRLTAHALRNPPLDPLPRDFAAQTAARVESALRVADERLEVGLQFGLFMLLALAGIASAVMFGGDLLRLLWLSVQSGQSVPKTIAGWSIVIAVCLGLSAATGFRHRHR